jgi:PD-(D/E)XK nuclease superfamily protein
MTTITDPIDLARATEILRGYTARWGDDICNILAVEFEFDAPLVNPETGAASPVWRLGGKIDAMVERAGKQYVVEHKTSSEDLEDGATYWKRLTLDSQMSTYLVGARTAGFDPVGIIYDVIGKPKLRPKLATPSEARKYTAKGQLYANQREADESLDEFTQRLREEIKSDPERYFVRGPVVRLEQEERDAARDVWQTAANIRVGRNASSHPRNPDACFAWNTACTYWDVCSGTTTLADPLRFRRVENVHEELSGKVSLPVLTNSQMSSFRRCQHLHHLRYAEGYRAVQESEARRFGTLIHKGLEGWWLAAKEGAEPRDRFIEAVGRMSV